MTHRDNVLRKLGLGEDEHPSLSLLSKQYDIPIGALQDIYNRGIGAWKTNISSVRLKSDFSKNPDTKHYPRRVRLPKEQWAMARVYSFLDKGKDYYTADSDIAKRTGY